MCNEDPLCPRTAQLFYRVQGHLVSDEVAGHIHLASGHAHRLAGKDHIVVHHVGQGTFCVSRCLEYRDLMITEV